VSLHAEIENNWRRRCCRILLQRLEAEHQHGVLARGGRKAADFESARIVGGSRDLAIGAALGGYGRARDWLSPGANDTGLHVGSGYSREYQQNQTGGTQHEYKSSCL
jgi:hypothetical protein